QFRGYVFCRVHLAAAAIILALAAGTAGSSENPPATFKYTNHLIHEKSPYLLLHAHNPVDWYPWGEEAFRKARQENKPIFLSVGYYTCHWCHVMERESYSNPQIAAIVNRDFVAIKVDREERPDVDEVYTRFLEATTGDAGWPMNVFLTPDLQPFFGGTYFPPVDRGGLPGLPSVLKKVALAWQRDHAEVLGTAAKLTRELSAKSGGSFAAVEAAALPAAYSEMRSIYDATNGGFGGAPKFPRPVALEYLMRYSRREKNQDALAMVQHTLDQMARGGVHDQLGGGFHRYATDRTWLVPHFEKMLYDQAQLALAYLHAFQITHDQTYARTTRDTLDFVLREMRSPEGGFYSALDADSRLPGSGGPDREGAYYLWSAAQIKEVLGPGDAPPFEYRYGVGPDGNVPVAQDIEGNMRSMNVLYQQHSVAETAAYFKSAEPAMVEQLEGDQRQLLRARSERSRPPVDSKIVTAWNAMLISALACSSQVLHETRYLRAAQQAASMLEARLYSSGTGQLKRRYRLGAAEVDGFLSDYASLIEGLLDLYEASFDLRWLNWALELQRTQDRLFWDQQAGGYFTTGASDQHLLWRDREAYDGAEPSANSVAAMNLLRIWQITEDDAARDRAVKTISAFGGQLNRNPESMPAMMSAYEALTSVQRQIVIAGNPQAADTRQMLDLVWGRYLPNSFLMLADQGAGQQELARKFPFLANMRPKNGKATAYVCQNYVCNLPSSDPKVVASLLDTEPPIR
ncbi:MAG TPA: thioredoxin domain-containing protein, partial [Terriglobales bacterium]|nr:thioredoxin domain-containing protein [Terriglobales bacterium]